MQPFKDGSLVPPDMNSHPGSKAEPHFGDGLPLLEKALLHTVCPLFQKRKRKGLKDGNEQGCHHAATHTCQHWIAALSLG